MPAKGCQLILDKMFQTLLINKLKYFLSDSYELPV